jgi:hypothetical protein
VSLQYVIRTSTQGAFLAAGTGISKVVVEGGVCVCVVPLPPPHSSQ